MSAAASSRSTAGSIDLARRRRRDDENTNNNNNRNKRRNISNQRVKVGAIGEVIRFRNFETSWNSNEKTLAFERKDERFRDVQFRENQFRLLEPLLAPLGRRGGFYRGVDFDVPGSARDGCETIGLDFGVAQCW